MIKRPIFKSPRNWNEVLRKLESNKNGDNILLCKIEVQNNSGLDFVTTNVYFLITKGKNTLSSQIPTRNRQQNTVERINQFAKERDIPPQALKSLYISKKDR